MVEAERSGTKLIRAGAGIDTGQNRQRESCTETSPKAVLPESLRASFEL